MVQMNLFTGRNKVTNLENRHKDTAEREGEGGNWERALTYIYCVCVCACVSQSRPDSLAIP